MHTYVNIILLTLLNMTEDRKKDKDKDEKTVEEKADGKGDSAITGKRGSEQPEEEEIQEHPEH